MAYGPASPAHDARGLVSSGPVAERRPSGKSATGHLPPALRGEYAAEYARHEASGTDPSERGTAFVTFGAIAGGGVQRSASREPTRISLMFKSSPHRGASPSPSMRGDEPVLVIIVAVLPEPYVMTTN
jgi:hypothetical protein